MRIRALTKALWRADSNLLSSPLRYVFTDLYPEGQWGLVSRRLPPHVAGSLKNESQSLAAQVLDKGFFFPASTPWVPGVSSFKNLMIASSEVPPITIGQLRSQLLWEVLEGPNSELGSSRATLPSEDEGFESSARPLFYSGIRHTGSVSPNAEDLKGFALLTPSYNELADVTYKHGRRPLNTPINPYSPLVVASSALSKVPSLSMADVTIPKLPLNQSPISPLLPYSALTSDARSLRFKLGSKRRRFPVPQVRYKPGLSKSWRALRLQFCLAWSLPWLRQRRFTNYVSQLTHVTGISFFSMCVNSIGSLIRTTGLVGACKVLGECAFVNGRRIVNPLFQVYKGDRVSLVKAPLEKFSRWQRHSEVLITPPLKGWEVDGLTRAVSIFYEATLHELTALHLTKPLPFLTFRMYNWKYRH